MHMHTIYPQKTDKVMDTTCLKGLEYICGNNETTDIVVFLDNGLR